MTDEQLFAELRQWFLNSLLPRDCYAPELQPELSRLLNAIAEHNARQSKTLSQSGVDFPPIETAEFVNRLVGWFLDVTRTDQGRFSPSEIVEAKKLLVAYRRLLAEQENQADQGGSPNVQFRPSNN